MLKMEKKKENVRREVSNTTLEAKTTIKGERSSCNDAFGNNPTTPILIIQALRI